MAKKSEDDQITARISSAARVDPFVRVTPRLGVSVVFEAVAVFLIRIGDVRAVVYATPQHQKRWDKMNKRTDYAQSSTEEQ